MMLQIDQIDIKLSLIQKWLSVLKKSINASSFISLVVALCYTLFHLLLLIMIKLSVLPPILVVFVVGLSIKFRLDALTLNN